MKHRLRLFAVSLMDAYRFLVSLFVRPIIGLKLVTAYHPVPDLGISIPANREEAVAKRWDVIKAELPADPASVLDIGCNLGFYTIASAKLGHFAMGVDIREYATLLSVIRNRLKLSTVVPVELKLSPQNTQSLPAFDVIIMLQVFHHLCVAYGADDASDMLRTIWQRTRSKFIFEVEPSSGAKGAFLKAMPDMGDDIEAWLRETLSKDGDTAFAIRTILRDEGRNRTVFCIERTGSQG